MKLIITLIVLLFANTAQAYDLTKTQEQRLDAYVTGIYMLTGANGPTPPYICTVLPSRDHYYVAIRHGMEELLNPLSKGILTYVDRNLINYSLWAVTRSELGCDNYDPTIMYDLIPFDDIFKRSK